MAWDILERTGGLGRGGLGERGIAVGGGGRECHRSQLGKDGVFKISLKSSDVLADAAFVDGKGVVVLGPSEDMGAMLGSSLPHPLPREEPAVSTGGDISVQ